MAYGEFWYVVNAKGRTTVPACLRNTFSSGMTLTLDPGEKFLRLYPLAQHDERTDIEVEIEGVKGFAADRHVDKRGRFTIPLKIRKHAEIDKIAVFVAIPNYVEIWGPEHWEAEKTRALAGISDGPGSVFQ